MANPEHLKILNQGIEAWNKWRKENPVIIPDLTKVEYEDQDPEGTGPARSIMDMLIGVENNFLEVDISEVDLSGADLTNANLPEVYLTEADIRFSQVQTSKERTSQEQTSKTQISEK